MKPPDSFLWHDYETFGAQPMADRPAQFAAQRTDADLNPLGEPVVWYCSPADDVLPHPVACLITGITPQEALRKGIVETEFAENILHEMMQGGHLQRRLQQSSFRRCIHAPPVIPQFA